MPNEREWTSNVAERLQSALSRKSKGRLRVSAGQRLAYRHEVSSYEADGHPNFRTASYETDLLICELSGTKWTPRVVIECKLGEITTHDALTYSAKAATHKNIHPYLRYGVLIGDRAERGVPARLFRHGANFDFMTTWGSTEPTEKEWKTFRALLMEEVDASIECQLLMDLARTSSRKQYSTIRRQLRLGP